MADADDLGGCLAGAFAVIAVVTAVAIAVATLMTIGALYGAGTALRNYGLAFANNIKREKPKR